MRNSIILLILFWGLGVQISAQSSLAEWQNELNNAKHDTAKLKCYNKIIFYWTDQNMDSAGYYIHVAENLSNNLSNNPLNIEYWFRIHIYYKLKKDIPNAKVYLDKAKQLAIQLKDNGWIKQITFNEIRLRGGDNHSQAIKDYLALESTLDPSVEQDKKLLRSIYEMLTYSYYYLNNYKKSIEYCDKILPIALVKRDTLFYYNTRLFVMVADTNMIAQSEIVFQEGSKYAKDLKNMYLLSLMNLNIGDGYIRAKQFDKALKYTQQALALTEKENFIFERMICIQNLGQIYHGLKEYNKALQYYKQAIPFFRKTDIDQLAPTLENVSLTYKELGDYKNAYLTHFEASVLKEQVAGKDKQKMVAELEAQYALNEKEVDLHKKNNQIKRMSTFFDISVMITFSIIGGLFLLLMYIRNRNQQEKNTILKQKNAEISRQNEILIRTNRDLEQFAFIISHDLKEPVRSISSFATLLKRKMAKSPYFESNDYIDFIINGAKQMNDLLHDLLIYSQINIYKKAVVNIDLSLVIQNVLHDLEIDILQAQAHIEYRNLPSFMFDKNIKIVFKHLISNALKFRRDEPPYIRIEHKLEDNDHVFSIQDNGIGIDKQYFDRIFVPFQRLHDRDKYNGTSLGLATCKKILEQSEGTIWLDSEIGKGSTFYIKIPILSRFNAITTPAVNQEL